MKSEEISISIYTQSFLVVVCVVESKLSRRRLAFALRTRLYFNSTS